MNVLSLFDGMSCGQIALKELGIVPEKYYASEIDKFAIKQTQHNFTDTIQLGDVTKWKEWMIDWGKIDLILAGSPCQGFSFAGKQLAFDDPRSKLFFVFVDILNHVLSMNPNVKFLLENVNMKREHLQVITSMVGVAPVNINSALVSAQNRNRWYWTTICTRTDGLFSEYLISDIPQPKDERVFLKDILENEVDEKYYLSVKSMRKIICRLGEFTNINPDKSKCLTTRYPADRGTGTYIYQLNKSAEFGKQPRQQNRVYSVEGKSPTLTVNHAGNTHNLLLDGKIRRMTPTECDRLQTIPEWYEWVVSESQHYKLLGNGWTVKVIAHILKFLNHDR